MSMTPVQVEDVYKQIMKRMPLHDRLRLATLILNNIPPAAIVDYGEEWSEEDIRDVTLASLRHAVDSFKEEEHA